MGIRRSFKPTNLVTNGNFAKGTTGWIFVGAINAEFSNNEIYYMPNAKYGRMYQIVPWISGHKYYLAANIYGDENTNLFSTDNMNFTKTFPHSNIVGYEYLSCVFTITTASLNTNDHFAGIRSDADANWVPIKAMKIRVIDLTLYLPANLLALSDADLKTWCDLNIPNWFDGTLSGGRRIGGLR